MHVSNLLSVLFQFAWLCLNHGTIIVRIIVPCFNHMISDENCLNALFMLYEDEVTTPT